MKRKGNAEVELALAREHLAKTLSTVRSRLQPRSLAEDGKDAVRRKALSLAGSALASRKGRPVLAVGAIMAGAGYLLRKPLARAIGKRLSNGEKK